MNSLAQFLTRRRGAPKHGSDEQPAMPANAAPSPDSPVGAPLAAPVLAADIRDYAEAMRLQGPSFTPGAGSLANAQPFTAAAPPFPVAQGSHARTGWRHVPQSGELLQRVLDGIQAIPLSRAGQFTADLQKAKDGGLPVFRATVVKCGFCDLDEEYLVPPLAMHGTQAWTKLAEEIDNRFDATQAELGGTIAEQDRYEARRRVAADAAIALGYPGGTL
jgi:hypothetical protein